jgi:hypothetical protein
MDEAGALSVRFGFHWKRGLKLSVEIWNIWLLLTNGPINFDPDYCLLNPKIKMIKVTLKSLKEDRSMTKALDRKIKTSSAHVAKPSEKGRP